MAKVVPGRGKNPSERGTVKSCDRTIDVLEYFASVHGPVRTSEVSATLGLPNSSIDDILRTFAARGYLTFNRLSKTYQPSYKIIGTARAIERSYFGDGRMAALLRDLRDETGATVYMTVQNDCWLETVAALEGSWHFDGETIDYRRTLVHYDDGGWRPATNFAGILLASQSNVDVMDVAGRSQKIGIAASGAPAMGELIERVGRIRTRGYALCRRNDTIEVESIACPLPSGSNVPVAIGLIGHDLNLRDEAQTRRLAMGMRQTIARYCN